MNVRGSRSTCDWSSRPLWCKRVNFFNMPVSGAASWQRRPLPCAITVRHRRLCAIAARRARNVTASYAAAARRSLDAFPPWLLLKSGSGLPFVDRGVWIGRPTFFPTTTCCDRCRAPPLAAETSPHRHPRGVLARSSHRQAVSTTARMYIL